MQDYQELQYKSDEEHHDKYIPAARKKIYLKTLVEIILFHRKGSLTQRDGYWVMLAKDVSDLPSHKFRKTDFKSKDLHLLNTIITSSILKG